MKLPSLLHKHMENGTFSQHGNTVNRAARFAQKPANPKTQFRVQRGEALIMKASKVSF